MPCCNENDAHLQHARGRQARMLWIVLAINAGMFAVEFGAGWLASSTALMGDSLDMLGDALVYGLSLFVVARSGHWKALSAGVKGLFMLGFGLLVLGEAAAEAIAGQAPQVGVMAAVGGLALIANLVCLALLTRHRDDDVNMRSSWICSRNDLFANVGVLGAAALVALSGSLWPDIAVGIIIAGLFLHSAIGVLRDARANWSQPTASLSEPQAGYR
ncbi:cation diffusion facilitator family transporter [Salinisphaera sp.]|uniref:cation diffusion facilitator family transporter n=1 Tax=Salinisphaera sp. TaxID=1914330 RepID=UPI002D78AE32|nr:cation diffusion facilitator family transporter [Salinisphaera sp.]HET7314223.1 cation diffusion facilitator family transporter [Salinisphaera sp.]